jgi:hypothetical protein
MITSSELDNQNPRHTFNAAKRFVSLFAALTQPQGLLKRCSFMGSRFPGSGIGRVVSLTLVKYRARKQAVAW